MKIIKLLSLILALFMLLSVVACNNNTDETNGSEEQPSENVTADTDESTAADTDESSAAETDESTAADTDESTAADTDESTAGTEPTPEIITITIAEALELCGEPGNITTERYYIRATIKSITNPQYGQMIITDGTGEIEVYGTYSADGELNYSALDEKPYKGDEVLLHCILQNYNGTKEVKNARLIEFKSNQGNVDVSTYTPATVAEARDAAEGAKLKVSGTVARITYANGMKPNGFILVDGAASIYVYDGDAAARVAIGNRVEIAASKTYWILADEQSNAARFGYKGCNQLEGVTLISNDEGNSTWINESIPTATVKELMDNPVSNDITTQIYKVTALVKKVPGQGFVNYYFNDLDGATGSYTYTQCNGGDFAWLDQFDGKICTVYLTILNAKSSASGCVYRFLPVEVIDEGYTFDVNNAAEHAVKYYGVPQLGTSYTGDPALELITDVDSALLGFENAALTYASSDASVVAVSEENGKTILHCLASGTATVTVTATHNGNTYSEEVVITVTLPTEEVPSINVAEAIATANGTEVTVKGIVGPSLVNQVGFYLIDESGVIAVRTSSATMSTIKMGNEVIVKGERKLSKDTDGQICIHNAELVQNNYGSHSYSTASFITDKTISDVIALDGDVSHTVEVYVVTGTVRQEVTNYSTNTYVGDGPDEIMLYAGGKDQYKWLTPYLDQTVTIELAVCDWNAKGNKGCVLSITTEDGTQIFNTLNFDK